jgi:hypothetical protein
MILRRNTPRRLLERLDAGDPGRAVGRVSESGNGAIALNTREERKVEARARTTVQPGFAREFFLDFSEFWRGVWDDFHNWWTFTYALRATVDNLRVACQP